MKGLFKIVGAFIKSNSSTILTMTGIAGMAVACGMSVKAYEQTKKEIAQLTEELGEKPTKMQVVKRSVKHWVWPFLAFATSTGCIAGAHCIVLKERAAWISAYKLAEASALEFKEVAKEVVGPDTVKQIEEKFSEQRVEETLEAIDDGHLPANSIHMTGDGNELIYDDFTGDLFYSSRSAVDKAFNTINNRMNIERYMTLRELLDEQNRPGGISADINGWNVDSQGLIQWHYDAIMINDHACLGLHYTCPVTDYRDRY